MKPELTKERMVEMARKLAGMEFCPDMMAFYGKVLQLVEADADGRLVILPCKAGDECHVIRIAEETKIVKGIMGGVAVFVKSEQEDMLMNQMNVFKNYEAAEAALKKMRDRDNI